MSLPAEDRTYYTVVIKGDIGEYQGNPLDMEIPFGKVAACGYGNAFDREEEFIEAISYACQEARDLDWLRDWADGNAECAAELRAYRERTYGLALSTEKDEIPASKGETNG